jgi:hypothetical protein
MVEFKTVPAKENRMPTKPVDPRATSPVPLEYAGKWVAWASDHSQILAQSDSIQELWQIVQDRGIPDPIFEKVPRSDMRFVGTR